MNETNPTPSQTRLQSSALGGLRVIDFTHFNILIFAFIIDLHCIIVIDII